MEREKEKESCVSQRRITLSHQRLLIFALTEDEMEQLRTLMIMHMDTIGALCIFKVEVLHVVMKIESFRIVRMRFLFISST